MVVHLYLGSEQENYADSFTLTHPSSCPLWWALTKTIYKIERNERRNTRNGAGIGQAEKLFVSN